MTGVLLRFIIIIIICVVVTCVVVVAAFWVVVIALDTDYRCTTTKLFLYGPYVAPSNSIIEKWLRYLRHHGVCTVFMT
jgi:hypothetical protein